MVQADRILETYSKFGGALAGIVLYAAQCLDGQAQEPALANLSIRANVEADVHFVSAFTIPYGREKTVLVRAVGPSLSSVGVSGALADPKLEIYDSEGMKLAENDNFDVGDAALADSVGAFPLIRGGKDAALIKAFPEGKYFVRVTGVGGSTGTVLVELYELNLGNNRFTAFTSYAQVGGDNDAIISGFNVSPGIGTRRLLFRAVGMPLQVNHGIDSAKVDPWIEVFSEAKKIAENDNWSVAHGVEGAGFHWLAATFLRSGAVALDPAGWDAALVLDLAPGNYTLVARSAINRAGGVLVEAYEVPPDPNPDAALPPAALQITDFVVEHDTDGYFRSYYPRFTLVEATGRSGLTVVSIVLRPEGANWLGPPPTWKVWLPVAAGGRLSMTSPANAGSLFFEGGPELATSVTAIITYRLSDGPERTVLASAPIAR